MSGNERLEAQELERRWQTDPRWHGVKRTYTADDVLRLRGSVKIEHTLATLGAKRLWHLLQGEEPVRALGALSGAQAVQMVQAGLQSIYISGWQVAGDVNTAGQTYPDQSIYPVDSVPKLVQRINNALRRADQIDAGATAEARTGSRPWWPMPRPGLAACSTPTSS